MPETRKAFWHNLPVNDSSVDLTNGSVIIAGESMSNEAISQESKTLENDSTNNSGSTGEMDDKKTAKLASLCRICLNYVNYATNLFDEDNKSKEILDTVLKCFHVVLSKEKYLPSAICNDCSNDLNIANNFRLKCLTFDKRFAAISQELLDEKIVTKCIDNQEFKYDVSNDHMYDTQDQNLDSPDDKSVHLNKIECNLCTEIFSSEVLFKHHLQTHKTTIRTHVGKITGFGANRRHHCTMCTYNTPHSQTLVNHMRRHNGERPYHCECGKTFTQSSSLSAHRKTHSNLTYYMCTVCGKQFKHAFTLKKHSRVHENAQFPCTICKKKLKSHETLQDHMHRHYNVRNYNCEDCGDTFVTSSELLNHKKKHSSVKTVECHLCGYKTHTKKNLIVHLKRHAGDKSHKCDICHMTFFSRGDVHRHQRVHTREKPFTCPVCVQRFTYSTSLNKHMLTVHNIKYKWSDFKWKESRISIKNDIQIKQ